MEKKLTRPGLIEYCNKCKHVSTSTSPTVCSLTNQPASFDYECEKFVDKGTSRDEEGNKSFFGSWKSALVMSILGFLRFGLKLASGSFDIFGLLFLILGIGWLLFALFGNED